MNPARLMAAKPLFATKPLLLPLDGLGVRDLLWSPARKELLILAGPTGEGDDFRLDHWSGDPEKNPVLVTRLDHLHAEALALGADDGSVLALADQGDDVLAVPQAACKHPLPAGKGRCKDIKDGNRSLKTFIGRAVAIGD